MYIYRGSSSPVGNLTQISQIADKISAISCVPMVARDQRSSAAGQNKSVSSVKSVFVI